MPRVAGKGRRKAVSDSGVESVRRAVAIVQLLSGSLRPMKAREISNQLELPLSSTYGILRELGRAGWVKANPEGFAPTSDFAGLAGKASRGKIPFEYLDPLLQRLRDETQETVQLCVLSGNEIVIVAAAQSLQTISVVADIGRRSPVNWMAAGRVLLAALDDVSLAASISAMIVPSPTGRAPTSRQVLLEQVRSARRQGYWFQIGESADFMGAVAAPVFDGAGRCVAAISVVAPEHRLKDNFSILIERLRATANEASHLAERTSVS